MVGVPKQEAFRIPLHTEMPIQMQLMKPSESSRALLASYVRFVVGSLPRILRSPT